MSATALAALPELDQKASAKPARRRRPRRADGKRFYSPAQLSELTGIPEGTLAQWRHRKFMFDYHKTGSHILYSAEHVEQVLARQRITASDTY